MSFTKVLIVVMMIKIVVVVMIMVIKKMMIIIIPPYKSCLCLTGIIGHITVGFQQRIPIIKGMLVVMVMMVVVITTTSVFEYCKIPTLDLLVTPKGSCWCR